MGRSKSEAFEIVDASNLVEHSLHWVHSFDLLFAQMIFNQRITFCVKDTTHRAGDNYAMDKSPNQWLGDRLDELGRNKGQLAKAMGVANARITNLLNGRYNVPLHRLPAMSRFLEMPLPVLIALLNGNQDRGYGYDEVGDVDTKETPPQNVVKLTPPYSDFFLEAVARAREELEIRALHRDEKIEPEELDERAFAVAHALIGLNKDGVLTSNIETLYQILRALRMRSSPEISE